jgi:tetratricopeptide (TPR) repeat protein
MKKLTILVITFMTIMSVQAKELDDSVKVLLKKAKIEQEAGRQKMALEYLQMAVAVDPNLVDAQKSLGLQAIELRQFDIAKQAFLKVLASQPNDAIALENVLQISFNFRKWEEAIQFGKRLLVLNQGKRVNYMVGKSYYELEDYGQCYKFLESAFIEEPKNIEIPTMFARSLMDMSNFKAAARYYLEALKIDSNNNGLLNELAMTYSAMNDEKAAVVYYEKAMEKGYRVDNNFVENISNSYIAAGMPEKV